MAKTLWLLLALLSGACFAQEFYPVRVGGKWGFINGRGQVVIPPLFDSTRGFEEDLAAVKVGNKVGFIDRSRHFTILPRFDSASSFSEGLANVQDGTRRGFIDKSGRIVVPPQNWDPRDFNSGLAHAVTPTGREIGFIDHNGHLVIKASSFGAFVTLGEFSEGFATVSIPAGPPKYGTRIRLIDTSGRFHGKELLGGIFTGTVHEGMLTVSEVKGGKYGYMNTDGSLVIPQTYNEAEDFSEGLAAVKTGGKWGFIDHSGKQIIPPTFDGAHPFAGGLAAVAVIGKGWGYIDKSGEQRIPCQFVEATTFENELAAVFVSTTGKYVGIFGENYLFTFDTLLASPMIKMAYIDKQGRIIWREDAAIPSGTLSSTRGQPLQAPPVQGKPDLTAATSKEKVLGSNVWIDQSTGQQWQTTDNGKDVSWKEAEAVL